MRCIRNQYIDSFKYMGMTQCVLNFTGSLCDLCTLSLQFSNGHRHLPGWFALRAHHCPFQGDIFYLIKDFNLLITSVSFVQLIFSPATFRKTRIEPFTGWSHPLVF